MNKTPETDKLLGDLLAELGTIGRHNCPEKLVVHARRLEIERDEAMELAEQMSESNQVLLADVRFYRQKRDGIQSPNQSET